MGTPHDSSSRREQLVFISVVNVSFDNHDGDGEIIVLWMATDDENDYITRQRFAVILG